MAKTSKKKKTSKDTSDGFSVREPGKKKSGDSKQEESTDDDDDEDDLSDRDYSGLKQQCQKEFDVARDFMRPKLDEWALRLKVYSNQKRDKTAVGDPLLFTIFQTVFSSLYEDRLNVSFEGREEGDAEQAENLTPMAEYDYIQMQKAQLDYDWNWNTLFYGRALLLNMEFSRDKMCPLPEVIDMMTWVRDPNATSVNGDVRGRGSMRYGGREIRLYKNDIEDSDVYFNVEKVKPSAGDPHSLLDKSERAKRAAQGYNEANPVDNQVMGENSEIRAIEWFTYHNGKKVFVTFTHDFNTVIRYKVLDDQDKWPIDERVCYPIAHDWDGVSLPDLVEDKQRARSVVQNSALNGIKAGQQPTYLYDTTKIKNRADLDISFNKHIPIDGPPSGAVQQIDRQQVKSEVDWILGTLDQAAQSATAAPATRQGGSGGADTATEANLQAQGVDTRYSLTAKLWGWSEREFWRKWYDLYKRHFKEDIDEKVIRLNGAMGSEWRRLTRENVVGELDPDILIESQTVADQKNAQKLQQFRGFLKDVMSTDPESANVRFALREVGQLSGLDTDQVERILPPSYDEMHAEEENKMLDENEKVEVDMADDDLIHIEMHNKAADTPAKYAHIRAHKRAMRLKRKRPDLDPGNSRPKEAQEEANFSPNGQASGQPAVQGIPGIPATNNSPNLE